MWKPSRDAVVKVDRKTSDAAPSVGRRGTGHAGHLAPVGAKASLAEERVQRLPDTGVDGLEESKGPREWHRDGPGSW